MILPKSLLLTELTEFKQQIDTIAETYTTDNKKKKYLNIPISFDIETTSLYSESSDKVGFMYAFILQVDYIQFLGRTWKDFTECLNIITETFIKDDNHYLLIYCHNLAFEFQFFRKLLEFKKVFALKKRKVCECITTNNIIFRCSYLLTGLSLANLGKKIGIKKLLGDLDYSKTRHSTTILTHEEIQYIQHDTLIVVEHIRNEILENNGIHNIPLTKTGYTRNYYRKNTIYAEKGRKKSNKYRDIIKSLTLEDNEYLTAKRAFQGGFTHANAFRVCQTYEKVTSLDISSSYPFQIACKLFPMSKGKYIESVSRETFLELIKKYNCIFDIEFLHIEEKVTYDNPISSSKCFIKKGYKNNNGRIVKADYLKTTITEIDYNIYSAFYSWADFRITNLYYYRKMYIPTEFTKTLIELYADKTTLKDVKGEEVFYQKKKEGINASFGMCVTDITQDTILYNNDEWDSEPPNFSETIEKYNKNKKRFLSYLWGIYITAYARQMLFHAIYNCKHDYIYSDTDSVKILNYEKHKIFFDNYNIKVIKELEKSSKYHNIPLEKFTPKTIENIEKPLGVWEIDKKYKRFKTLGAKRYAFELEKDIDYNGENIPFSITVSGLNKNNAVPYLFRTFGHEKFFDNFNDNMEIPKGETGKLTLTYIDELKKVYVTDYTGKKELVIVESGIHAENASFNMSLAQEYINYLLEIKREEF